MPRPFSDRDMWDASITQSAEEFAAAVGHPVEVILLRAAHAKIKMRRDVPDPLAQAVNQPIEVIEERAKAAGIVMRRDEAKFMIGCNIPELVAGRKHVQD